MNVEKIYISGIFRNGKGCFVGKRYIYAFDVPNNLVSLVRREISDNGKNAIMLFQTPVSNLSEFSRLENYNRIPDIDIKTLNFNILIHALDIKLETEKGKTIMKNRPTILFDDYANTVFNLKGSHVQLREGVLTEVEKETKVHSLPAKLVPLRYESPEDVEIGTVFEFKQRTYIVTGTLPLLESFDEAGNRLVLPYPVKNIFSKVPAIDINAVLKENITFPSMKAVDSEMVKFVNDNFGAILEKEKTQKEANLSAKLGSFLGFDIKK